MRLAAAFRLSASRGRAVLGRIGAAIVRRWGDTTAWNDSSTWKDT